MERAHIGRIERGEKRPSLGIVLKLADALGCDAGQLVSETVQVIKNETPASTLLGKGRLGTALAGTPP